MVVVKRARKRRGVTAKLGHLVGSRRVAKANTYDRKRDSGSTHFAVIDGLKQACWQLLAVLRRGKIHVGAGGDGGGEEVFPSRRIENVCVDRDEVVARDNADRVTAEPGGGDYM
jgi:hypothetical protein